MIGSLIDDAETSGKLKEIIGEENRHIQLLEEFQDEDLNTEEKTP
jgi:rubrerythrin